MSEYGPALINSLIKDSPNNDVDNLSKEVYCKYGRNYRKGEIKKITNTRCGVEIDGKVRYFSHRNIIFKEVKHNKYTEINITYGDLQEYFIEFLDNILYGDERISEVIFILIAPVINYITGYFIFAANECGINFNRKSSCEQLNRDCYSIRGTVVHLNPKLTLSDALTSVLDGGKVIYLNILDRNLLKE